jgi:hypothetical protein
VRREIIGHTGLDACAQIGTHEESLVEEGAFIFGAAVRGGTFRMEVVKVDVGKFVGPTAQSLDEDVRDACNAGKVNVVSAAYRADGLIRGYKY